MATLQRERVAPRKQERAPRRFSARRHGRFWAFGGILVVAAVVSLGVYAGTNGSEEAAAPLEAGSAPVQAVEQVAPVEAPAVGASLFSAEELKLMELAGRGYIPEEAVNWELMETKRLVARGLIPATALAAPAPAPLYTQEERVLMDLVSRGLIPEEVLETEGFITKQLVNQGLIPREAVD